MNPKPLAVDGDGILLGLIAAGSILLVASSPSRPPLTVLHPTPVTNLVVSVSGAVKQPGVYTLSVDSRVNDAIMLAGGTLPQADMSHLNLAKHVADGETIFVPTMNYPTLSQSEPTSDQAKININLGNGRMNSIQFQALVLRKRMRSSAIEILMAIFNLLKTFSMCLELVKAFLTVFVFMLL